MTKRLLVGVLIGAVLLLFLDAAAMRMGIAGGVIPKAVGTSAWMTSRTAGVCALLALSLDAVFGLFVSSGIADRLIPRARSVAVHRWLSSVTLALVAVHALSLTADPFVRFDALDATIPFASSYRPFAVGLGVFAAHGALITYLSFWFRHRIGAKTWRKLHYASFFAFAAAIAHGVLAGSDSNTLGMQALYVGAGTVVGALSLFRLGRPLVARVWGWRAARMARAGSEIRG